jgi:large subunit ribosomal protein L31
LPSPAGWLILRGLFGTPHVHKGAGRRSRMKAEIHPKYKEIKVLCSCGNQFTTRSTLGRELHIEVCSACHPFYTGQQKILDTGGRVDQFKKRYRRGS